MMAFFAAASAEDLGAVGRGKQEYPFAIVRQPAQLHHVSLCRPGRRSAKPLAMALPKVGQVRLDLVERLRSAQVPAKAGDHLVEDEEGAVAVGEIAQAVQEAVAWRLVGALGLERHAGNLARMLQRRAPRTRR